jgi:hypothetical protein
MSNLVLYGVWDIFNRETLGTEEIAKVLLHPKKWSEVARYALPIIKMDEDGNQTNSQIRIPMNKSMKNLEVSKVKNKAKLPKKNKKRGLFTIR